MAAPIVCQSYLVRLLLYVAAPYLLPYCKATETRRGLLVTKVNKCYLVLLFVWHKNHFMYLSQSTTVFNPLLFLNKSQNSISCAWNHCIGQCYWYKSLIWAIILGVSYTSASMRTTSLSMLTAVSPISPALSPKLSLTLLYISFPQIS